MSHPDLITNDKEKIQFLEHIMEASGDEKPVSYENNHNLIVNDLDTFYIRNLEQYKARAEKEFLRYVEKNKDEDKQLVNAFSVTNNFDNYFNRRKDFLTLSKALLEEWRMEAMDEIGLSPALFNNLFSNEIINEFEKYVEESNLQEDLKAGVDYAFCERFKVICEKDKEFFFQLKNQIKSITDIFRENDVLELSIADKYMSESQKSESKEESLSKFILSKKYDDKVVMELGLTKSQNYSKVVVFEDSSLYFVNRKDEKIFPDFNASAYREEIKKFAEQYVDYIFRKKPKYKEIFKEKMVEENYNFTGLYVTSHNLLKYEGLLKSFNIDAIDTFSKEDMTLEKVDDFIAKLEQDNKLRKFSSSIMSKKYEHLRDEKTDALFKDIYELKVSKEELAANVGAKMASFKTPSDLNKALSRYYNSLNEFEMDAFVEKANKTNCDIISTKDNKLIIKVNDFEASSLIGSASWCISRQDSYFDSYTKNGNEQYMIFDFNKDSRDNDSMIGVTLDKNKKYYAGHYKDDGAIVSNKEQDSLTDEIVKSVLANKIGSKGNQKNKLKV